MNKYSCFSCSPLELRILMIFIRVILIYIELILLHFDKALLSLVSLSHSLYHLFCYNKYKFKSSNFKFTFWVKDIIIADKLKFCVLGLRIYLLDSGGRHRNWLSNCLLSSIPIVTQKFNRHSHLRIQST